MLSELILRPISCGSPVIRVALFFFHTPSLLFLYRSLPPILSKSRLANPTLLIQADQLPLIDYADACAPELPSILQLGLS